MNTSRILRAFLAAVSLISLLLVPSARAQLINTSVRTRVGTGADVLISGFVVGATPKTFLFRASGPALRNFGVNDVLNDPLLKLFSGSSVLQSNDDWSAGSESTLIAQAALSAGAFAFATGSKDAALIATLAPGGYTVQISGADNGTGIALFEAYEISAPAATAVLRGIVRDGVTRNGVSGVTLNFTGPNGLSAGSVQTGATGEYSINLPAGAVTATISLSGYVSTVLNAIAVANATVQADSVLFAQNQPGNGTISGRITNALTGQGLSGATLRLRAGVGVSAGAIVATATTTSTGDYTLSAVSGSYTVEIALVNFVTTYFVTVAVGGQTLSQQNSSISPVLTGNDIRIVLTWGVSPSDLDSHLTGPSGSGRFHVYYSSRSATGAILDVDDVTSYGPETITISQFTSGTYRYSVHDYSNGGSSVSTAMSNVSGAQVRVFQGSTQIATFNVPSGRTGNLWTVFEIDGATRNLTPVNTVGNVSGASSVPSRRDGGTIESMLIEDDMALMERLPVKL